MKIDFSGDSIKAVPYFTKMHLDADAAMICDNSGRLLFYTNGISITDSTNQPMLGGESLYTNELIIESDEGLRLPQNNIILPCPGSDSLYYLIYSDLSYNKNYTDIVTKYLYYAVIDMSQNQGKGKVMTKNKILIDNILLDTGNMTTTRHANGRDWWLIVGKSGSSECFRFLISPEGIKKVGMQDLPPKVFSGLGQACFSPDGTKYAKVNGVTVTPPQYVDIYDFDRCKGLLSNHKQLLIPDTSYGLGLAFSANSRFLYLTIWTHLYQLDMQDSIHIMKLDTVATYDGFRTPILKEFTLFMFPQLAPDGKIYISTKGSSQYLHVIQEPNKKGKACNVTQHSFELPTYNYHTIPNYPNFRLGKLAGVCDSVVAVEEASSKWQGKVYPNPAQDILHIEYPTNQNTTTSEVTLFDIAGKAVLKATLPTENTVIDVRSLPTGLYLCKISDTRGGVWYEKVSVVRYP
ncbi:MAG: hypothetical protein RLZZ292_567 [Bacteroidota bacterium]